VIAFPLDHTATADTTDTADTADTADRGRLAIIHYDTECGAVGAGDRLNFSKKLFTKTGVNESPRRYRNNLIFLLAESTRVDGLEDAVQALIAWERVHKDIETEQSTLAQSSGADFRALKDLARRGAKGVPAELMALEYDLGEVQVKLGVQELNVRSKLLDAYRVLAFPKGGREDDDDLFGAVGLGSLLECFRVDFGERPDESRKGKKGMRHAVAEQPILQCLRHNNKLVPEPTHDNPIVPAVSLSPQEIWAYLWPRSGAEPALLRAEDLSPIAAAAFGPEDEPRFFGWRTECVSRSPWPASAISLRPMIGGASRRGSRGSRPR
jgi:hypothetical protein